MDPVDPKRVLQIVLNLLTNAIRYNRARGRVEVRVRRDVGHCVVAVIDNGTDGKPGHSAAEWHLSTG